MKVLIAYYSETGNTERVAGAIYDAVREEKTIKKIAEVESLSGYDLVFIGFPVQSHSVPIKAMPVFKLLDASQKVALFSTHGSLQGGELPRQAIENALGLCGKATVLGTFGCRGKVSANIIAALMKKPEHKAWAEEAQGAARHPDENDLEDARDFARQMISKA